MILAFGTGVSGIQSQLAALDVIANNLANVNTDGFKKSRVVLSDLASAGQPAGLGVKVGSTDKIFSSGNLASTEQPLDLAIQGDGFFQAQGQSGIIFFTRNGAISVDGQGRMVTSGGYILAPQITIPAAATSVNISQEGAVSATLPGAAAPQVIGQIQLAKFSNPSGLTSVGNGFYAQSANSGTPISGSPGSAGFGTIAPGFSETSNVDVGEEMVNMLLAQRAFEANLKSIKTADQMLSALLDISV